MSVVALWAGAGAALHDLDAKLHPVALQRVLVLVLALPAEQGAPPHGVGAASHARRDGARRPAGAAAADAHVARPEANSQVLPRVLQRARRVRPQEVLQLLAELGGVIGAHARAVGQQEVAHVDAPDDVGNLPGGHESAVLVATEREVAGAVRGLRGLRRHRRVSVVSVPVPVPMAVAVVLVLVLAHQMLEQQAISEDSR